MDTDAPFLEQCPTRARQYLSRGFDPFPDTEVDQHPAGQQTEGHLPVEGPRHLQAPRQPQDFVPREPGVGGESTRGLSLQRVQGPGSTSSGRGSSLPQPFVQLGRVFRFCCHHVHGSPQLGLGGARCQPDPAPPRHPTETETPPFHTYSMPTPPAYTPHAPVHPPHTHSPKHTHPSFLTQERDLTATTSLRTGRAQEGVTAGKLQDRGNFVISCVPGAGPGMGVREKGADVLDQESPEGTRRPVRQGSGWQPGHNSARPCGRGAGFPVGLLGGNQSSTRRAHPHRSLGPR